MSKIGYKPVDVLEGVHIETGTDLVTVKGPLGELMVTVPRSITAVSYTHLSKLERNLPHRSLIHHTTDRIMEAGAKGVKIQLADVYKRQG